MKKAASTNSADGGYAMPTRPAAQARAPRHRAAPRNHEAGQEPEQRIPLLQPPAPDQLEDHEQEEDRRDRGRDRDSERGQGSSSGVE